MPRFGPWTYALDREATVAAYARAGAGGSDKCTCTGCRNLRLVRSEVYPAPFLELLDGLGVDPLKNAEVAECGDENGRHNYMGWFHFVGRLDAGEGPDVELAPAFWAWISPSGAPRLLDLPHAELVEIHFFSRTARWLLDEPEH